MEKCPFGDGDVEEVMEAVVGHDVGVTVRESSVQYLEK